MHKGVSCANSNPCNPTVCLCVTAAKHKLSKPSLGESEAAARAAAALKGANAAVELAYKTEDPVLVQQALDDQQTAERQEERIQAKMKN